MEIQLNEVSCCKIWFYWMGLNHKIYSRHVVIFLFTLTQLLIKNLQHDSTYTCMPIKDFDFER